MNTFRKLITCASLITISFGAVSCTSPDSGNVATETITATKLAEHDMDRPGKTIKEEQSEEDEQGHFVIDKININDRENSVKSVWGDTVGEYYFTLEDGAKLRCIIASNSGGISCNWDYALRKLDEEQNATGEETTASTEETESSTPVETSAEETSTTAEETTTAEASEKETVTITVTAEAE